MGIGRTLNRASQRHLGDEMPVPIIFSLALVMGPVGGLLSLWFFAHLLRWTGRWLGGLGNLDYLKAAWAWAWVPSVFSLAIWIPQYALIGSEMFNSSATRLQSSSAIAVSFLALVILQILLGVWTFILCVHTVAEVQGFQSSWRGLGNVVLSGLVVAAIAVGIVLVLFSLR